MSKKIRIWAVTTTANILMATLSSGHALAQSTPAQEPAPAQADTTAVSDQGLTDIVVTAQRRSESLQKTSITINVVSNTELARAGVTGLTDISRVSPGVVIAGIGAAPQIYIRGVGDFAATALNNPAIALNVDGVYAARSASLPVDMYDLERVEVLKGPQGTLYGRNASGGAINLITARPRLGEFGGAFSTELGNYDAVTTNAAINIPIGDTLAVRVAGNYIRRDGFSQQGFGDANSEAIRLRALWQPSDAVSLLLSASTGHVGGKGGAVILGDNQTGLGKFVDGTSPQGRAFVNSRISTGTVPGVGVVGPNVRAQVVLPDGSDGRTDNSFTNISAELNVDLGFANLTLLPAYRDSKTSFVNFPFIRTGFGDGFLIQTNPAQPPSPANQSFLAATPETSKATSFEARLANENDVLKWVIGGYYFDEEQYSQYTVTSGPIQNIGIVSDLSTKAWAAFGQASFSVTDRARLIGGIRYTADQRELTNGATYALPGAIRGFAAGNGAGAGNPPGTYAPYAAIPGAPFAVLLETYEGKETFRNVSWKAGVEYDVTPSSLFYATASSGFKAGGFNQLSTQQNPGKASAFQPEKLTAFDVGLKSRLLNNRVQLNLAGFYWDYRNQQVNRFGVNSAGAIAIEFVNAQKAEIYGGSAEIVANLWTGGRFNGSVEYAHGRYKRFVVESFNYAPGSSGCVVTPSGNFGPAGPAQNIDCSGKPVTRLPEWSGTAGLAQDVQLGALGKLTFAGDVAFASAREMTFDFVRATRAQSYAVFNGSVTFAAPGDRFSILAFVRNITNEEVFTGGSQPNFAPGTFQGSVQLPRTYGVRFGFQF